MLMVVWLTFSCTSVIRRKTPAHTRPAIRLSDQSMILSLPATTNNFDDDITQDDDDCYQEARMSLNVQVINTWIIFQRIPGLATTGGLCSVFISIF